MAYIISNDCVRCGCCESACPAGAIFDNGNQYEIDPSKCVECGSCASACPMGIPKPE